MNCVDEMRRSNFIIIISCLRKVKPIISSCRVNECLYLLCMIFSFNRTCDKPFLPSESFFQTMCLFFTNRLFAYPYIHPYIHKFICLFFYVKYHVFFLPILDSKLFCYVRFIKKKVRSCNAFIISRWIKDGWVDVWMCYTI